MTDARDALMVGRNTEGKTVRRPLSPHLQTYKLPLTAMLSVCHRATGTALSVGTLLLTWWLVAASSSDGAYASVSGFMRSPIGWLLMLGWVASLWYHFCSGLRHLAWDAGYGLNLPQTHLTSRAVIIATGVLTVLTFIIGIVAL